MRVMARKSEHAERAACRHFSGDLTGLCRASLDGWREARFDCAWPRAFLLMPPSRAIGNQDTRLAPLTRKDLLPCSC